MKHLVSLRPCLLRLRVLLAVLKRRDIFFFVSFEYAWPPESSREKVLLLGHRDEHAGTQALETHGSAGSCARGRGSREAPRPNFWQFPSTVDAIKFCAWTVSIHKKYIHESGVTAADTVGKK